MINSLLRLLGGSSGTAMVLLSCLALPAMAEEAPVTGSKVEAEVKNGKVFISARLDGAFTPDTMKVLSGGAPITFTYVIQAKQERALLWDRLARQVVVKRVVKYDTLKKNYLAWEKRDDKKAEDEIEFEEELRKAEYKKSGEDANDEKAVRDKASDGSAADNADAPPMMDPLILPTEGEMIQWMSDTGAVDMGPVEGLGSQGTYYAMARLKVKSMNSSPPLTYILFFVSFLDFDTGWMMSQPFTMPAAEKAPAPGGS